MDKDLIIKRLLELEAMGQFIQRECCITRKMLEADSSASSTRKGDLEQIAAAAVARRNLHLQKQILKAQKNDE